MDIDNLRNFEIAATCSLLGLERDPGDFKQFLGDGFRISYNGLKWYDHSANKGGGGAIDLTMHIKQLSFVDAVRFLDGAPGVLVAATHTLAAKPRERSTTPPTPDAQNLPTVKAYLTGKRGLNADLVQWCIDKGMLYADSRSNCVFRYGSSGVELRGTGAVQWRSVYGTIEHGFFLPAKDAQEIAITESAIDALSYRQLNKGRAVVSIAGNGNERVIKSIVEVAIKRDLTIISAFDNDKGGDIAHKALKKIIDVLDCKNCVIGLRAKPKLKDWNDDLLKSNKYL